MKAFVYDKYGSPDFLYIKDIAKPTPKNDEVLVKVHAVSINDWDWGMLLGSTFLNRLGSGLLRPKKILGCDIAGRVESVGSNVKRFKSGDAVYGDLCGFGSESFGGLAEYVRAPEKSLAPKPGGMSFEQAAAIPQAGMLALQALFEAGQLRSGQKLLINGAGGGVGTFAIQLARLPKFNGIEVTGVDSAEKLPMLQSMGFDYVIDYRTEDFTKNGKRYDVIVDAKTTRSGSDYARALNRGGIYATVGGDGASGLLMSLFWLLKFLLLRPWIRWTSNKNLIFVGLKPNKELAYLNELFEAGQFVPVIDGRYQFTEHDVREAFRYFGAAKHKGKIVVTVANS